MYFCTFVACIRLTSVLLPLLRRHPTSCCSVAEIMSVLFFHTMRYRYDDPRNFNNDRFILSKVRVSHSEEALCSKSYFIDSFFLPQGHAAPALYSMWVEAGFLKENELLSLCHVDSTLEGHPTPVSLHVLYALLHTGNHLSWF